MICQLLLCFASLVLDLMARTVRILYPCTCRKAELECGIFPGHGYEENRVNHPTAKALTITHILRR
jgi:hypothetical protein